MGLFGSKKRPEIYVPTADDLLQQSLGFMKSSFPQFTQARETGLAALMGQGFDPQIGIPAVDYSQFAPTPTSLEQELATSAFQPLIEQAQRQAMHIGSLAGMPSAAPAHFGRAISPAMVNMGQFLAGQQQQRFLQQSSTEQERLRQQALMSEAARQYNLSQAIGQDPYQELMQGAELGQTQTAVRAQQELQRWAESQGGGSDLLALIGGVLGTAMGGPAGGALGAAGGKAWGSAFGGDRPDVSQELAILGGQLGGRNYLAQPQRAVGGQPGFGLGDLMSLPSLASSGGLGSLFGGGDYSAYQDPLSGVGDVFSQLGLPGATSSGAIAGDTFGQTVPLGGQVAPVGQGGFGGITPSMMFPNLAGF